MRLLAVVLPFVLLGAACRSAPLAEWPGGSFDARAILLGVQARHRVPRSAVFWKDVTLYGAGGEQREVAMQEWLKIPGRMRVDVQGEERQSYVFDEESGSILGPDGRIDVPGPSLPFLLTLDLFVQSPEVWLARARAADVAVERVSVQAWEGGSAWVIGALPGELERNQVWIDAERWLPVRVIEDRTRDGRVLFVEGRVRDYRTFAGGVVFATRFEAYLDGERVMNEVYREIALDVEIPDEVFDREVVEDWVGG